MPNFLRLNINPPLLNDSNNQSIIRSICDALWQQYNLSFYFGKLKICFDCSRNEAVFSKILVHVEACIMKEDLSTLSSVFQNLQNITDENYRKYCSDVLLGILEKLQTNHQEAIALCRRTYDDIPVSCYVDAQKPPQSKEALLALVKFIAELNTTLEQENFSATTVVPQQYLALTPFVLIPSNIDQHAIANLELSSILMQFIKNHEQYTKAWSQETTYQNTSYKIIQCLRSSMNQNPETPTKAIKSLWHNDTIDDLESIAEGLRGSNITTSHLNQLEYFFMAMDLKHTEALASFLFIFLQPEISAIPRESINKISYMIGRN